MREEGGALPQDSPTLVLLPGLHGTAGLFAPLQSVIPPGFQVQAIAYPTDRACRYDAHYAQVESLLEGRGNLVLIAESYSGSLALRFAAAHPERVRAVILCVSFIAPPVPRILCYLATLPVMLRVPLLDIGIRTFLSGFRAPRQTVRDLRREVRSNRPWVLAHRIQQMAWVDGRAALKACTMPILCIAATRDRLVGRRSMRRLVRIRPDVPVKWLDGPHLLVQTRPAEVWEHISEFLTLTYTSAFVQAR
jgi:pimeloyl-ACP methyl ester carboxylesterase